MLMDRAVSIVVQAFWPGLQFCWRFASASNNIIISRDT